MKRNFVEYEVFEKMKENALSTVVHELIEAQDHLARMLGTSSLVLESFDDENVIYQKDDGTFIKSAYSVSDDAVTFDNLEELVIDEASETTRRKEIVQKMLEAILDDKEAEANVLFQNYMELASQKHHRDGSLVPAGEEDELTEARVRLYGTRGKAGKPKIFVGKGAKDPKRSAAATKGHRLHAGSYKAGGRKRHAGLHKERARRKSIYQKTYSQLHSLSGGKQYTRGRKHCNEWLTLCNNVFEYADFVENGHVLSESVVRRDEKGEMTAIKMPTSKARNEGKILKMHYDKMIKQDSPKVMRETGLRLAKNPNFAKAVAEMKRHNNTSDNEALEDTINKIIATFPAVLYMTQNELAQSIGYALEQAGETNFADQTCEFMAEGILRTAYEYYEDRIGKLLKFARVDVNDDAEDRYVEVQKVIGGYFDTLDEAIRTELKVFEDLYNAVLDVRKFALESRNDEVRTEANELVSELESILNGEAQGNVGFAVEVADWLNGIAEANLPGSNDNWDLPKTPHHTVTGDHPQMAKNAKVDGIPSKYSGDWGDTAPMIGQDSMSWNHGDEARNRSWGNKGGKDVWPNLSNPAVLKPFGDYKMKGEKSVEDDGDNFGTWQSSDTWAPQAGLNNPYVPKAIQVKQKVDTSKGASVE